MAIASKLEWHHVLISAIESLDKAGKTPSTIVHDRLLMVSIGGDPDSMSVGRFLPCRGKSSCPDIKVRCACGFVVDKGMKSRVGNLLKPHCKHKTKHSA